MWAVCSCLLRWRVVPTAGVAGGGGVTPSSSSGTTITGSISAPNGSIASLSKPHEWSPLKWLASLFVGESYAQASNRVPNAPVIAYRINDQGQPLPIGNPTILAQTTTNANGEFTFNLPSTGVDIVVVGGQSTPQPICTPGAAGCGATNNYVGCPAVAPQLNIDAATTFATRLLRDNLPAGSTLGNAYTQTEVNTFIAFVVSLAQNLGGANIADVIAQLQTNSGTQINNLLAELTPPGPPSGQSLVSGAYQVTEIAASMQSQNGRLEREVGTGTVTFNNTAGTYSFSGTFTGRRVDASCSAICQIAHAITPISESESETGTFLVLANNRVALNGSDGVFFLTMNPTGTLGIFTESDSSPTSAEMDFGVVVKKGSGLSTASLQGPVNTREFEANLAAPGGTGLWTGPLSVDTGGTALTFTGTNLTGSTTSSTMGQNVTCTPQPTSCTLSATLSATPINDPPFIGTFTVGPDGATTVNIPGESPIAGHLSADANLLVLSEADQNMTGLILGVKQGTGMSVASLNGTYALAEFGDAFGTQNASMGLSLGTGTVVFNGAGAFTATTSDSFSSRTQNCSGTQACSFTVVSNGSTSSEPGSYTVSATGQVTVDTTITGWASPDGSVVVFTEQTDNVASSGGNSSVRNIGILLKQ